MIRKVGFTLIELMLVVLIIGVLAAMVVPRLAGRSELARISIAKADIDSNITLSLDLYELDNNTYPTTEQGLNALIERPASYPSPVNWNGPYIKKEPIDPWGNSYKYSFPATKNIKGPYDLYSLGPDRVEGVDDITNWQEE